MPSLPLAATKHWKILLAVAITAGMFAAGYKLAAVRYSLKIEQARTARLEATQRAIVLTRSLEQSQQALADSVAAQDALRRQKAKVVEKVVQQEVIRYVETDNARQCGLNDFGVYVHDTAARGDVPENSAPAAVIDDNTVRITNAEVIRTVTDNYVTCNETRDRLLLLQEWAKGIAGE